MIQLPENLRLHWEVKPSPTDKIVALHCQNRLLSMEEIFLTRDQAKDKSWTDSDSTVCRGVQ